jgi:hypothetical protein
MTHRFLANGEQMAASKPGVQGFGPGDPPDRPAVNLS